jgi:hypothetical protein
MRTLKLSLIKACLLFVPIVSWGQFDPIFYNIMIPHDKVETIALMLKKEGVELNIESQGYAIVNHDKKSFFLFKKKEKSDIRAFKILRKTENFYLLCLDDVELCNCKGNTFLYIKQNNKLQRIQRPFSMSMKKDLLKRMEQFSLKFPPEHNQLDFCELLSKIE